MTFSFDLCSPFSYLAAERVERLFGTAHWQPAWSPAFDAERMDAAERRAAELRLPLVWPERFPCETPSALRVAAYASEIGSGAVFALAASRLMFCGGFDIEDPEILTEAAAAAGIGHDDCLAAADDERLEQALRLTSERLTAAGVGELPAVRIGRRWFAGEASLAGAMAARAAS